MTIAHVYNEHIMHTRPQYLLFAIYIFIYYVYTVSYTHLTLPTKRIV